MTTYQRHLLSNRLRRIPRRIRDLDHEIVSIEKRSAGAGRDLLAIERDQIGHLQAHKNRLRDRGNELLTLADL